MWDKHTRLLLVSYIYTILYWDIYFNTYIDFDINKIIESIGIEYTDDKIKLIEDQISIFLKEKITFSDILTSKLENWDKTSLMVKSILFAFLLEQKFLKGQNINQIILDLDLDIDNEQAFYKRVANNYLKISDKYIDSTVSSTVHAIIVKLI